MISRKGENWEEQRITTRLHRNPYSFDIFFEKNAKIRKSGQGGRWGWVVISRKDPAFLEMVPPQLLGAGLGWRAV